ncbi:hypothetical protein BX661DRAFT_176853 [Kickxella alabastrina]|uniref:uncharacterized protein n=1 Tax=Kickxella alabastrina TaxID=61397 RepID=UPI00221E93AE|nr:uncharacterized protein BX661DRAFT_176853 [Kickxella alabastrina]KAI7834240.1 hypothetical protein BX661DRAFT_176853 [Kickxella alabastrina]
MPPLILSSLRVFIFRVVARTLFYYVIFLPFSLFIFAHSFDLNYVYLVLKVSKNGVPYLLSAYASAHDFLALIVRSTLSCEAMAR